MPTGEICILAGGLGTRLGGDKARLRIGRKTLLGCVRSIARQTTWPVRVIRRDAVGRCGPLGGVYTALKTTSAERVLFLACDMPFVTAALLDKLIHSRTTTRAIFCRTADGPAGFPFLLDRKRLKVVEHQIENGRFSLQELARRCKARAVNASASELFNINSPEDFDAARKSGPVVAGKRP